MAKPAGLWLTIGGDPLSEQIETSIYQQECFSSTVETRKVRPRKAELVIVSLRRGRIDYVGISQLGRNVVTGQTAIFISHLVVVGKLAASIKEKLPIRFRNRFEIPDKGTVRLTPRLWEEVLTALGDNNPSLREKISDLRHIVASSGAPGDRTDLGLEAFERDAVATAVQTWGGQSFRKKILRRALPRRSTPTAPFLSQLQDISVREDPLIQQDLLTFPGMADVRRDIIGSVVLSDPFEKEYLTILNCNRQPLEQTLGVDLIYYNHQFDSFILVQYKRMAKYGHREPEYRPSSDASHSEELQRMTNAEAVLATVPGNQNDRVQEFRLTHKPFFIKLCESKIKNALDAGMVSGMYIPLDLWRHLLASPSMRGPRGGVHMTWTNCTRRFNNGDFTNLLRHGWIGSAAGQSQYLSKIIEDVLSSSRMLVLAATSDGPSAQDFRRDGLGRFAANDDPEGAR